MVNDKEILNAYGQSYRLMQEAKRYDDMKTDNYKFTPHSLRIGITWYEKFRLLFIKPKYSIDEISNKTIVYKIFNGKIFIIRELN